MTQLSINTTQNVQISFTAASVIDRILAYLTDLLIKVAYCIVIFGLFYYLVGFKRFETAGDPWTIMAIVIILYFPVMIYTLTLESIFDGQTLGKRLLKIKVVKIDGYQASFSDYLMRWFFRIIDIAIMEGVIAIILIATSPKSQRLGDMAAGTAVISLKNTVNIDSTILEEIGDEYVPTYPLVIKLSDNDIRIVKDMFNSALSKSDYDTMIKLREKVEQVSGIKNLHSTDHEFLRIILKDYNYYTQSM